MLAFNSTRNSLQLLKSHLTKMQLQQKSQLSLQTLSQQHLKSLTSINANNQLFLPLLNFILIQYSSEFYIRVLDRVPDLKLKDDRKFVENCIAISRDMLAVQSGVTAQQFLSQKFLEKKLQFLANLAKAVYQWVLEANKKNKARQKQIYNNTNVNSPGIGMQFSTGSSAVSFNSRLQEQSGYRFGDLEDQQQEVPMKITAVPMKIDLPQQIQSKKNPKSKQILTNNRLKEEFQQNQGQILKLKQPNKSKTEFQANRNQGEAQKSRNNSHNQVSQSRAYRNNKFMVDGELFDEHQIGQALQSRSTTPQNFDWGSHKGYNKKQNLVDHEANDQHLYDKKLQNKKINNHPARQEWSDDQQQQNYEKLPQQKRPQVKSKPSHAHGHNPNPKTHQHKPQRHQDFDTQADRPQEKQQLVTRQQFNQLVNLIKIVSETVNSVSAKFADLEQSVNAQVHNINARVIMLEGKVKVLQDNI